MSINSASNTFPQRLTNVAGQVFFMADDGLHGWELWKSDGTAAGTFMVKDIRPGADSSLEHDYDSQYIDVTHLPGMRIWGVLNNYLFFAANDGIHGWELWRSDGTAAGTVLLKDIQSGAGSSNPDHFTFINNALYFFADNGVNGSELWVTYGTPESTQLADDIWEGPNASFAYPTGTFARMGVNGDSLYLPAGEPAHGTELWKAITTNSDSDNDGYNDYLDAFPNDPNAWLDTDKDGMPDNWENQYGLNPLDASDALLDKDGDSTSNLAEYQQGRDPTDPTDATNQATTIIPIIMQLLQE